MSAIQASDPASQSRKVSKALILGFVLCAIGAIWVVSFEQARLERRVAIDAAIKQNENRVLALEQYVRRTLEAADLATLHIAERYLDNDPDRLARHARTGPVRIVDRVVRRPSFAAVNVVDGRGNLIATTIASPDPTVSLADQPLFISRAKAGEVLRVNGPARSKLLPGQFIFVTRRHLAAEGSLAGFVDVLIRPQEFTNLVRDAAFDRTDLVSVIGLDGITIARRTGDQFTAGEDVRGKLVMRMQARDPNGTYLGPSALDGIVRYFSHRRLAEYGLFVTSGISRDAILAAPNARARGYMLAAGLATIIFLFGYWQLIRSIDRQERLIDTVSETNSELVDAQRIGRIGNWKYDPETDLLRWSSSLNEMYGRTPEETCSPLSDVADYVGPTGYAEIRARLDEVVRTGKTQEYPLLVKLPGGMVSHRHVIAEPCFGPDGKVNAVRGTDQDVSVAKRLEVAEARIAELSRLSSMNAMASTIAHELNQPLTAAANYLWGSKHLLTSGNGSTEEVVKSLDHVSHQIQHAGAIIKQVRTIVSSRPNALRRQRLSLMTAEAIETIRGDEQFARIQMTTDISPASDLVLADQVQIKQVLVNLIRNAGEAAADDVVPRISITACPEAEGLVKVSVEDNGRGFPKAHDDPFSCFASSKAGGLGLGLSISRSIIEAHGGTMIVERSDSTGSVICFTLQAAASPGQGQGED